MLQLNLDPEKPVVLLGDTHSINKLMDVLRILKRRQITGLNIIHLGDTGLTFVDHKLTGQLRCLQSAIGAANHHMYAIRGNHDMRAWFDGRGTDNITLLPDYTVLSWRETNILAVGGSISIDRQARIKSNDWYDPEEPTDPLPADTSEYPRCQVVVAHDVPQDLYEAHGTMFITSGDFVALDPALVQDTVLNRRKMSDVRDWIQPCAWFAGHYHKQFETSFQDIDYRILAPSQLFTPHSNVLR
jgi:hypothetical protein